MTQTSYSRRWTTFSRPPPRNNSRPSRRAVRRARQSRPSVPDEVAGIRCLLIRVNPPGKSAELCAPTTKKMYYILSSLESSNPECYKMYVCETTTILSVNTPRHNCIAPRELIDLYSFYASMPIGYNHPYFSQPEVEADLLAASKIKVACADVYSVQYATFVSTFARVMGMPPLERYFFIDGGALAVEIALKAAMDWK